MRPWAGPVADIYYAWLTLGRDMNGGTLHSERDSWLHANGWSNAGDAEAGHYFFLVLEAEAAEVREILHPAPAAR